MIREWVIFYFSGTGNARQVALWFESFAKARNIDCHVYDIAYVKTADIRIADEGTLIAIISPIHGFNFPKITLDFIRRFPRGNNKVALMNTRGGLRLGPWVTPGLTGVAFMLSSWWLKKKGYSIVGQIPFDMPSNWISIHPALRLSSVQFLHSKNYDRAKVHADRLLSGEPDFLAHLDIIQDILIAPVSLAYYLAGRFGFAKSFYSSPKCDHCGLCIRQCPVQAITSVDGRPYWHFTCESCMKCMNSCPNKAIETAHGMMVITGLLSSTIMTSALYAWMSNLLPSVIVKFAILNLFFFFLLWLTYGLQHFLLRYKIIGTLISYTSLTHFPFWGRYKSIPDKQWRKPPQKQNR